MDYESAISHALTLQANLTNHKTVDFEVYVNIIDLHAPTNFADIARISIQTNYRFEIGGVNFQVTSPLTNTNYTQGFTITPTANDINITPQGTHPGGKLRHVFFIYEPSVITFILSLDTDNTGGAFETISGISDSFEHFTNFLCAYSGRCE